MEAAAVVWVGLDTDLVREAQELGGFKTKREAVLAALEEYVRHHKRQRTTEIFGTIDYEEGWDPRVLRGKAPIDGTEE